MLLVLEVIAGFGGFYLVSYLYGPDFTFYEDYFLFLSSLRTLKYSCNSDPLAQSVERGANTLFFK